MKTNLKQTRSRVRNARGFDCHHAERRRFDPGPRDQNQDLENRRHRERRP